VPDTLRDVPRTGAGALARHPTEFIFSGIGFPRSRRLSARTPRSHKNGRKSGAPRPKRIDTAGIGVAFWLSMRPFFLAWLTVALLLLVLGKFTGAADELSIAGFLNATDQEAAEGYFAVGGDTMVVVKQGSGVQRWLKSHAGQRVRVTLTADVE